MYTTSCNCVPSAATTTHVIPTTYHHMTTATTATTTTTTTFVETPLVGRARPVTTEYAVPSTLPQGHHPLAVGKNKLLTITILLLLLDICMHQVQTSISACMYPSLMIEHPWAVHFTYICQRWV